MRRRILLAMIGLCLVVGICFSPTPSSALMSTGLKTVNVDNIPPSAGIQLTAQKKIDLIFNVGNTSSVADLSTLQSKVNADVLPTLYANNISPNVQYLDGTSPSNASPMWVTDRTAYAIKLDGSLWSWGNNSYGQIGNGLGNGSSGGPDQYLYSPYHVTDNVKKIVGSQYAGVALKKDGTVWSWGTGYKGDLGRGLVYQSYTPTQIPTLSQIIDIECIGDLFVALTSGGDVYTWGDEYGDGSSYLFTPQKILSSITRLVQNTGGYSNSTYSAAFYGVDSRGNLWTWGPYDAIYNSGYPVYPPRQVPGITNFKRFFPCTYFAVLAQTTDGKLWFWGDLLDGGTNVYTWKTPTELSSGHPEFIGAPNAFVSEGVMVLGNDGNVYDYGPNGHYNYGYSGSGVSGWVKVPISGVSRLLPIGFNQVTYGAVKTDGSLWVWGANYDGETGLSGDTTYPRSLTQNPYVTWLSDGATWVNNHIWLNDSGTVYGWNPLGGAFPSTVPSPIASDVSMVFGRYEFQRGESIGQGTMYLMKNDHTLSSLGPNSWSLLGTGDTNTSDSLFTPTQILSNVGMAPNDALISKQMTKGTYTGGSDHVFVQLADHAFPDLNSSSDKNGLYQSVINDNLAFYGLGTSANQSDTDTLVSQTTGKGGFIGNSNLDSALSQLASSIVASMPTSVVKSYVVLQKDPATGNYISPTVSYNTSYVDYEGDPLYASQWKFVHDPSIYENNNGIIPDSGLYRSSPYKTFDKVGMYTVSFKARDNPLNDYRFDNYRKWSADGVGTQVLYVHRAPEAQFTVSTAYNTGIGQYNVGVNDTSYDLDHRSWPNRGVIARAWRFKEAGDAGWTYASLPSPLPANRNYLVGLKVEDADGAWSNETVVSFSTSASVFAPPVASFYPNPATIGLGGYFSLVDQSSDPQGQALTRSWKVVKDGATIYSSSSTPDSNTLKAAASGRGLSQTGTYSITLTVTNTSGLSSSPDTQSAQIVNRAPVPTFSGPKTGYRDSWLTYTNTTSNPDVDGDAVNYHWYVSDGTSSWDMGTGTDIGFAVKNFGLGTGAVNANWVVKLVACDPYGLCANATQSLAIQNQTPTATFTGPTSLTARQPITYSSSDHDSDSEDNGALQYAWRLTMPSGNVYTATTPNFTYTFTEDGYHTLQHWVTDPLGGMSNMVSMKIYSDANQPPVAGFTWSPSTLYRGTNVAVTSTAVDPDGYVANYQYFVTPPGGSESFYTSLMDFVRPFASLGTWSIRQAVTDSKGKMAQISHSLTVINQPPTIELTTPSGLSTDAPSANTPPFTAEWAYQDAEGDPQVKVQAQIHDATTGDLVWNSGIFNSSSSSLNVAGGLLAFGKTYSMIVNGFDGYDWSGWSAPKYFITDRPPTAAFHWTPSIVWEGDTVQLVNESSDPDQSFGDTLTYAWTITYPDGHTIASTAENPAIPDTAGQPGAYTVSLTATDTFGGLTATTVKTMPVGDLTLTGQIQHTPEWDDHRQAYNADHPAVPRDVMTFWAGERFMLGANVTDTTTSTRPSEVKATLVETGDVVVLDSSDQIHYTGEMWASNWTKLADGPYRVRFDVVWSNGYMDSTTVPLTIKGSIYDMIVTQLRN